MRRGRRTNLMKPKRGRAAIRAEIQGQGLEVFRGRAAFSHSLGLQCALWAKKDPWYEKRKRQQRAKEQKEEMAMATTELLDWLESRDVCADDLWDEECWSDIVATREPHVNVFEIQDSLLSGQLHCFGTRVDLASMNDETPLAMLQRKFLHVHGFAVCQNLQKCYRRPLRLDPVLLGKDTRIDEFIQACHSGGSLRPAFHGTDEDNFESIFRSGLLVPGDSNEVKVANGSVHGLGIYTGKLGDGGCGLSHHFSDGGPMLVCGVIDDALPVSYQLGFCRVNAESERIRHVGHAMVIFDSSRVAPLFVARPQNCLQPRPPREATGVFDHVKHARILQRLQTKHGERRKRFGRGHIGPESSRHKPSVSRRATVEFLQRRAARRRRQRVSQLTRSVSK